MKYWIKWRHYVLHAEGTWAVERHSIFAHHIEDAIELIRQMRQETYCHSDVWLEPA